jgi:MoaA/NifB/PqqE/SkfB family radical SAM enzyme
LTLRCNLRCRQCEEWKIKAEDLSTEFWKDTILQIKKNIGPYCIRFYGGEPFCRADLLELLAFCWQNKIITSITTNGTFIDQPVAQALIQAGVALINISLDGYKASTHDYLRGIPGTHAKIIQALDLLAGKIPVHLNTTIMQSNLDEIIDLARFARQKKVFITFQGYFPNNYSVAEVLHIAPPAAEKETSDALKITDTNKAASVLDELCAMKKNNKYIIDSSEYLQRLKIYITRSEGLSKQKCEAIGARLMLLNNGDINLCSYGGPLGSIGNLQKQSFKQIWNASSTKKKINKMRDCPSTECLVDRGSCKEGYLEKISKLYNIFFRA